MLRRQRPLPSQQNNQEAWQRSVRLFSQQTMPQILIVCTANICRSPVGEVLLRDRLQKRGLTDWQIQSAGTWAQIRRGASQHSVQLMNEQGFDITNHRATMIDQKHMEQSDLLLCMEAGHVEALKVEFPTHAHKVYYLSEMIGKQYSISDPYGGPLEEYQMMVGELTGIIDSGLDRIIELAQQNAQ